MHVLAHRCVDASYIQILGSVLIILGRVNLEIFQLSYS